jgi:hypothetical protein
MTLAVNIAQSGSNNVTFRNKIINGGMVLDQRNAGASVSASDGTFSVDRWKAVVTVNSKFTMQQNAGSVTAPVGFNNYLGATSSSAYAVLTGDFFCIGQQIEGFNFADMAWGTANAKTITLSFQVYSSLTGTFGGTLTNSAGNRSYPFSYTVSSANTWTSISVTVAGDTSGTWIGATNGTAVQIRFGLGAGATYSGTANAWAGTYYNQPTGTVSVVGTSGATFYITGVQLEAGTTASPFEYRQYGTELALCQRYYWQQSGNTTYDTALSFGSVVESSVQASCSLAYPVTMRTTPTITLNSVKYYSPASGGVTPTISVNRSSPINGALLLTISGATAGQAGALYQPNGTSAYITYSAEL